MRDVVCLWNLIIKAGYRLKNKHIFSITDFAKFTRTTRDTLLHYDRIGLLSPASRGENQYRYYAFGQLAAVNVIRTCQAMGMSLAEIKAVVNQRTPERVNELLEGQIVRIDEKINEWVRARKLLLTLKENIHSVLDVDKGAITVQFLPAAAIVLGDLNDYSRGRTEYDALLTFYHACNKKYPDMDLNYSVWGVFSEERILRRDWVWPDRYYFSNPEGLDKRPAALYAIGYKRGGYGQTADLYERMFDYIETNGFEVCGPAYEEYPLNEICVQEDEDYLIRLMITVREKA
jgi:DNA-binding transcriptional MerR regulator